MVAIWDAHCQIESISNSTIVSHETVFQGVKHLIRSSITVDFQTEYFSGAGIWTTVHEGPRIVTLEDNFVVADSIITAQKNWYVTGSGDGYFGISAIDKKGNTGAVSDLQANLKTSVGIAPYEGNPQAVHWGVSSYTCTLRGNRGCEAECSYQIINLNYEGDFDWAEQTCREI